MKLAQQGAGAAEIFSIQTTAVHVDDTTLDLTLDDFVEIQNSAYRGKLVLNKTKCEARSRKLWIDSKEMKVALMRLLAEAKDDSPDALLFPSRIHGRTIWSGKYLQRQIHPIARAAGIRTALTFRILRRTFATWNDDLGLDQLRSVQRIMGHTPGSHVTRSVYVQQLDERDAALVREYARVCNEEAQQSTKQQQRKKVTREELAAFEIETHRAATRAIQ